MAARRPTKRQVEVLKLLADGLPCKAIAQRLDISVSSATSCAARAARRLDVPTPTAAVALCERNGWLDPIPDPACDHGAFPLTPWMLAYLDAFDRHLRAPAVASRNEMSLALHAMRLQADGGLHAVG